MAHRLGVAVAEAKTVVKAKTPLVPNRESEGLKLAYTALRDGKIVPTKGMSKDEFVARARARNRK